ncbi:MAG: domain containing protein [Ilumatobacteraceae bacterium]|nr:domain containing protein [Ilumatobacteraceae bacterium]
MSTVTCPNGHQSNDPEWCDTCGAKIADGTEAAAPSPPSSSAAAPDAPAAAPAAAPSDPSGAASAPEAGPLAPPAPGATLACPHCGTPNAVDNLFCEQCGYDFTTGQAPPEPQAVPVAPPEEPVTGQRWVVIVEIDPQWFALKGELADQQRPAPSSSTVALAQHTALVGRTSQSRAVRPEIALDNDTGVSRRHAQFVRDGDDVSVVDLSSTNGTYVVPAGTEPDDDTPALEPGVPAVLGDGDRVFVGAWSRLTVRKG